MTIISWSKLKPFIFLLIILFIAYLPLSTFIFGMKNDAFSDNFPPLFFLSEAIHAGKSPLWNPYMNFGYPAYADMGCPFYNPIVWVFAFFGYSAYTLTLQVLLYLYIAGITMFYLGRYLNFSFYIAVAVAAMYMCSGFFVGALQHISYVASASFLPLLLLYFLRVINLPNFRNSFLLAVAAYFVCTGGHPAIPTATCFYLLFIFIVYGLYTRLFFSTQFFIVAKYLSLSVCMVALFLAPMIYSYANIFAEYKRYATQMYGTSIYASFALPNLISLIFPFSTASHAAIFTHDMSFRNLYFSIPGFVAVFYGISVKNKLSISLLIAALIMLFLSLGYPYRIYVYDRLPLLQFVRTNGHFRVFSILSFCCIAGFGLIKIQQHVPRLLQSFKKIHLLLLAAFFAVLVGILFFEREDLYRFYVAFQSAGTFSEKMKTFFASLSMPVALVINIAVALIVCSLVVFQKRFSAKHIFFIIAVDLIINIICYLPVTGVGSVTLKQIQAVYNTSPQGIPIPSFIPLNKIDTLPAKVTGLTGDLTYYNKQIGTTKLTDYPSYFSSTYNYFNSADTTIVNKEPYLFFKNEIGSSVHKNKVSVLNFSPNSILLRIDAQQNDTIVYLQNFYKYWHAEINDKAVPVSVAYHAFMALPVTKGISNITFYYEDNMVWYLMVISGLSFTVLLYFFIKYGTDKPGRI